MPKAKSLCSLLATAESSARNLRCEYRNNPEGLDVGVPRLSWTMASSLRGDFQSAYQILVSSDFELLTNDQGDLWNSGKVLSSQTAQIAYGGKALRPRMQCYWKVRLWNRNDEASPWSEPVFWTMGLALDAVKTKNTVAARHPYWGAHWIGIDEPLLPKPSKSNELAPGPDDDPKIIATPRYLRKEFSIRKKICRATLYATALGVYELRLNGRRVGNQLLAPEWTNYHRRIQYQTYEVTPLLRSGINALGCLLGNGWYCGLWQNWPYAVRTYGDEPLLLARLEIKFTDGTTRTIVSDRSWQGTIDGPLRFSGIYEGEVYDARREMPGWDDPEFDASKWHRVKVAEKVQAGKLVWQRSEPITPVMEMKPVAVANPKPQVYVFDFGQNMAGWCRFKLRGGNGVTVALQYAEMLNTDGTVFIDNLHLFNQADRQLDRYTFRSDGEETFEPHFTYHGFRYVEVTGLRKKPSLEALIAVVFRSSCPETGDFECSNPLINRLVANIRWSQRANFMGIPTDCPQRDERCGYPGDAQFFMPTAVYFMDVAAFFDKCLIDLCQDSADPKTGAFGDHMPDIKCGGYGNVGWGDAGIICPYLYYMTYGDLRIIREHYEPMCKHLRFWIDRAGKNNPSSVRNSGGPLDWLNLNCPTKSEVIATAYYAYLTDLMSRMALAIGKDQDAQRYRTLAAEVRDAFAKNFINPDGSIKESSQTGFALAFTMGLAPEKMKAKMAAQFVNEVERYGLHPATGFIGTPRLLPGLHAAGRDDVAYRLLLQESFPSWLYPVKLGATTIWELWDGWDGKNPRGGMNSLNHYAFGSVGEYLFGTIAGIQAKEPGYQSINIKPMIEDGLSWAHAHYDSIRGRIAVAWRVKNGALELDVVIPANTRAEVYVRAQCCDTVWESGRPASQSEEVEFLRMEDRAAVFGIGSGEYHFTSKS